MPLLARAFQPQHDAAPVIVQPQYHAPLSIVTAAPATYATSRRQRVQSQVPVTKEVPVCAYDWRTILVPQTTMENYTVNETRMVQIMLPVTMQRKNVVAVPRRISIPRPLVEKKIVRKMVPKTIQVEEQIVKMVPKVIQVEEEYEFTSAVTEMKTFFTGADTSGDGMLSYAEWQSANAARGYDAATMQQMFVSVPADFPSCHAMPKAVRAGSAVSCSSPMQGRRAFSPRGCRVLGPGITPTRV